MTISMYTASVPVFERQLNGLAHWLDKAEQSAQSRGFDTANYLQLRLAPDMLPFVSQVRIACDTAKGCVYRLAGQEPPKVADDETTLAQLRERVAATLTMVRAVSPEALNGSEQREVVLPMRNREPLRFGGEFYLKHWALPNFMFHCSMAYGLLRQAGVPLGKADFLALG